MNKQRIIDMHVHSDNSPDGEHSPMFICEQAVDKGLRAVAITDHCEIDSFFEQKYNESIFHSFFECSKARVAFEGQLLVITGLEIGQPLSNTELTEKVINAHSFDVLLGSIHKPEGFDCDIKEIDYSKLDVYEFMKNYFTQLTQIAKSPYADVLAHITCPMRRIQGKYGIDFDYNKISDGIDELLNEIINNKKSLEINTSGLRQPIGRTMPDEYIIKRYKQLGGKNITIGSDAHSAYDVGQGIIQAMTLAKECGFDKLSFYVNRQLMEIDNNIQES